MPFQQGPGQPGLTPIQHAICAFVRDYSQGKAYSPTYREIAAEVGLATPSAVKYQVDGSIQKGS